MLTINPISLDVAGAMSQEFLLPDASGLAPLEIPAAFRERGFGQTSVSPFEAPAQSAIEMFKVAVSAVDRPAQVAVEKPAVVADAPTAVTFASPRLSDGTEVPVVAVRPEPAPRHDFDAPAVVDAPVVDAPVVEKSVLVENPIVVEKSVASSEKPAVVKRPVVVDRPVAVVDQSQSVEMVKPVRVIAGNATPTPTIADAPTVASAASPKPSDGRGVPVVSVRSVSVPRQDVDTSVAVVVDRPAVDAISQPAVQSAQVVVEKPVVAASGEPESAVVEVPVAVAERPATAVAGQPAPAVAEKPATAVADQPALADFERPAPTVFEKSATTVAERPVSVQEAPASVVAASHAHAFADEQPRVVVAKPAAVEEADLVDEPATAPQAAPFVLPDAASATLAQAPSAMPEVVALDLSLSAATARTQELTDAAIAVSEVILVTPSLVRGEGEMTIRLKPTVLDGSEIRLEAKGSEISISVQPATAAVAQVVERSRTQFEQALAERLPSFQVVVSVQSLRSVAGKGARSVEETNETV